MKVILLKELKGRGGEGDVVEVAPGFANNYLFPQKIAIVATSGNLKQLEQRKHNIGKREETRMADASTTKDALEGKVIKIEAKVGEEGQLFGSVTNQMIADAMKESLGIDIDKKKIDIKSAIKTAGEHEVMISLYRETKTKLKIFVGSEEKSAANDAKAREELKTIEDAIAVEAGQSVKDADVAGDAQAAAEAAETVAQVIEAESKQ